ncbi:MAG: glycosyltransferase [Gammaproteobacteria bacterium]|nr:MAG: glycosyltransferase [Gammaproteobacteria bacterium]
MRILASPAFSNERVNPYNSQLYRKIESIGHSVFEYSHKRALLEKFDVVHVHWPDGYIDQPNWVKASQRATLLVLMMLVAKAKGARLVWTAHNLKPHDAYHPKFSQFFLTQFLKLCNGLIFLTAEGKNSFLQQYPAKKNMPCAIIPHGHYRDSYPKAINQEQAKKELGLVTDKKILLFMGMVKPYKNCDALIEEFSKAKLDGYILVIAGKPETPKYKELLESLAKGNENIYLRLEFIPDDQLHLYMSAADRVILPYKSILNSGALLLALSFDKPTIAPHIGAFVELQNELGMAWIYSYVGDLNAENLDFMLQELDRLTRPPQCPLDNYDWRSLAQSTIDFYQEILPGGSTAQHKVSL